ncbi:hypothetical protein BH23BAC1_BH23BAC1_40690 [soil metagenome]
MELIRIFKRKGAFILCSIGIIFYSCDNNQRTGGLADTPTTEETADTFEGDTEMENRRGRIAENLETQISRIQLELDSLRQELQTATAEEKSQIENHVGKLENDIENLEQQQRSLAQANPEALEKIERNIQEILHDWVETQDLDRSVRGEGTSLDGPDLNRTGTRTGTEVDTQVPVEIDDAGDQNPAVPSGP